MKTPDEVRAEKTKALADLMKHVEEAAAHNAMKTPPKGPRLVDPYKTPESFQLDLQLWLHALEYKSRNVSLTDAIAELKLDDDAATIFTKHYIDHGQGFPVIKKNQKGDAIVIPHSPENMSYLIEQKLKMKLRYNELKDRIFIGDRAISDLDLSKIQNEAKRNNLTATKEHILAVIDEAAEKNAYHPFKEAVESKPWDGHDHISALFSTLAIQDDHAEHVALYKTYLERWLVGVVAKVYQPGAQNTVLTLQGGQGVGKSRWTQKLGLVESCFGEGQLNPSDKDDKLKHLDFIVWHASELDGMTRKADVSALKDYFTKSDVAVRPAYGRFDRVGKSVLSFCASVNDARFLNDSSGSRRYLIIPVSGVNHTHIVDMQQVYAQALHLFQAGTQWWFNDEEIKLVNEVNDSFAIQNRIDLIASKVSAGTDELTAHEIFDIFKEERLSQSDVSKFGSLLKKKDILAKRVVRNGTKLTVYAVSIHRPSGNL